MRKVEKLKGQTKSIPDVVPRGPDRNHDLQSLTDLNEKGYQKKVPRNQPKGKQACSSSEANRRHLEPDMLSINKGSKRKLQNKTTYEKTENGIQSGPRNDEKSTRSYPHNHTQKTHRCAEREAEKSNHDTRLKGVKSDSKKSDKVFSESARVNDGCVTQWPVCRKLIRSTQISAMPDC